MLDLTGYTQVFGLDMNGPEDLQYVNLSYYPYSGDNALPSNNNVGRNYDSQISFADGKMVLTSEYSQEDGDWRSPLINTDGHFNMTYGYIEATVMVPTAPGFLSALWMLPNGQPFPEYDLMERPTNADSGLPFNGTWQGGAWGATTYHDWQELDQNLYSGYHTYGVMRDSTGVTFNIDHQITAHIDASPYMPDNGMYLIANMMVGAAPSWQGFPIGLSDRPQMFIDSIQAWEQHATTLSFSFSADNSVLPSDHVEICMDGVNVGAFNVDHPDDYTINHGSDFVPGPHTITVINSSMATLFVGGVAFGDTYHSDPSYIGGGGFKNFQI